jgi:hypothetical protein
VWNHAIFLSDEYKKFDTDLQQAIGNSNGSYQTSLQTVVPEILSAIEVSHGLLSTVVQSLNELQLNF